MANLGDARPCHAPGIAVETVGDEVLLYDPRTASAIYLNPSAAVIFGLCDGARTVLEICSSLEEAYPDGASISAHVAEALSSLREGGFVIY